MAEKFIPLKSQEPDYPNTWNPLRILSEKQLEMFIDAARSGRISQLQILYSLVEAQNLTLAMCIQRRESALPDWTIKLRETRRYRSFDQKLADEQSDFLYDQFVQVEDSGTLLQALDTLHKAVFRGLGVVLPIYDNFGLQKILSLDPWNFAIDFTRHNELGQYPLYWNPSGTDVIDFKNALERIPDGEVIANFSKAPIDNFGLQIYIAQQMGFESYCKLIARRGLPATYIVAPEDLPHENLQTWAEKAIECAKGGSGAFPYGTNVITQEVNPGGATSIEGFLDYMNKQIVLASTGGTLASLAQATGLGSNLADVQNDVFKTIVKHDAAKIGDLINRGIASKLLDMQFPGKPHLAYFDLEDESKQAPDKYLDDAVKAKNAGVNIDIQQLQELTGYRLVEEKQDTSIWNVPRVNAPQTNGKIYKLDEWTPETPENPVETSSKGEESAEVLNNTPETTDASTDEKNDNVKHGVSILKAFGAVLNPIRELFMKLFEAKTRDESKQIAEEIDQKIAEIEASEDNELIQAVQAMMKDEFEKGNE
jgi:hypothetical protein